MAWIEQHGETYRVRYKHEGSVATEPGYPTEKLARERVLELKYGAEPTPGLSYAQREAEKVLAAEQRRAQHEEPGVPDPRRGKRAEPPAGVTLFDTDPDPKKTTSAPKRAQYTGIPTLTQWVDGWIPSHQVSANTAAKYNSVLANHILPDLGHLKLNKLDYLEVKRFAKNLGDKGRRPTTIHSIITLLSVILGDAVKNNLLGANPCRDLKIDNTARTKVIATPAEVQRIAARLRPATAIMVITAAYTGMRWGEITGLQWHNVHLDAEIPHLTVAHDNGALHETRGTLYLGPPKTKASARDIALSPFLVDLLRALHESAEHDAVFTTHRGKWLRRSNFVRSEFDPAVDGVANHDDPARRAPIAVGLTFHSLRHCHKTWMTEDEIDEIAQNLRMGHAVPGIGAKYLHKNLKMQRGIINGMQDRFNEAHRLFLALPPAPPGPPPTAAA